MARMKFMTTIVALLAATACLGQSPEWVEHAREVHARFKGTPGTFAQFGDSITITLAFWAPLESKPKSMDSETARAYDLVRTYMKPECWREWKGPKFGSNGGMTIQWALFKIDQWLPTLNPEAAVIMFGSNDVAQMEADVYEQKTREVVRRCLENGTVVILTTPPPRSSHLEKSKQFAEIIRKVAREEKLPLIDYAAEILSRRPNDWDGSSPQFKDPKADDYQVATLMARDGLHPSNPSQFSNDFSTTSLNSSGYGLRNYLTLRSYADLIAKVFKSP
jgi:lysophospholipase L1-like esterase